MDAASGCKAQVKIEAGTSADKLLRLRGQGFPSIQRGMPKGDLIVIVCLDVTPEIFTHNLYYVN